MWPRFCKCKLKKKEKEKKKKKTRKHGSCIWANTGISARRGAEHLFCMVYVALGEMKIVCVLGVIQNNIRIRYSRIRNPTIRKRIRKHAHIFPNIFTTYMYVCRQVYSYAMCFWATVPFWLHTFAMSQIYSQMFAHTYAVSRNYSRISMMSRSDWMLKIHRYILEILIKHMRQSIIKFSTTQTYSHTLLANILTKSHHTQAHT